MTQTPIEMSPDGPEIRDHEFDGIHEFDNRLPVWWLWTFYLAIIFSLFYWMHFHVVGTGNLPREQYRLEMEAAAQRLVVTEVTNDSLMALAREKAAVDAGRAIFQDPLKCAQCHKPDGGGNIGPNLTDKFWIHGGSPIDIYNVVVKGNPEKGMMPWLPQLGQTDCQKVSAFVLSLRNTNVPGGKEPQGEPYDGQ